LSSIYDKNRRLVLMFFSPWPTSGISSPSLCPTDLIQMILIICDRSLTKVIFPRKKTKVI
jgi:hypothetical protein